LSHQYSFTAEVSAVPIIARELAATINARILPALA
jgi:hypothetical protein